MNKTMRRRIVALQSILVVVLAGAGAFAIYQGNFVTTMVHDQLAAQQISFPAADQVKAGGALDPSVYKQEIRDQAGKQVLDGNQARIYADDFINVHLSEIGAGDTYSQASAKAMADPTNTKLSGKVATLFKGETLRSILLNSYGWWQMGIYATYAGFGLLLAALVVLGALTFELFFAKRETT